MNKSKQRMTFSLPKDLVQRFKVFAQKRGKPMSRLMLEIIEDAVRKHDFESSGKAGGYLRGGRTRRKRLEL
jgi:predicted DNA-binding protein